MSEAAVLTNRYLPKAIILERAADSYSLSTQALSRNSIEDSAPHLDLQSGRN
jgi:hypothetical protein